MRNGETGIEEMDQNYIYDKPEENKRREGSMWARTLVPCGKLDGVNTLDQLPSSRILDVEDQTVC